MDIDLQFIFFKILSIALFVCVVHHIDALEVTASLNSDGVRGNNASFVCSWVNNSANEVLFRLLIKSAPETNITYYTYLIDKPSQPQPVLNGQSSRLSVDSTTAASINVTMRIRDLQCMDEKTYVCSIEYNLVVGASPQNQYKEASQALTLKVPPRQPTKVTVPTSLTSGVAENTQVSVTCSANTGRPGRGRIAWQISSDSKTENIAANDPRIITNSPAGPANGEDSCTVRSLQTFRMTANRTDQNLVIACFVLNDDFLPSAVPTTCGSTATDRCEKTEAIEIHYGVTTISVTREPQSDLYVGGSVTLKCFSDGFPLPTYTWVKVDDESRVLNAEVSEKISNLKLENLNDETDEGDYNCTASNDVNGRHFFVTDSVNIAIYKTTTLPPTTTTTPVETTEPQTGGTQEQKGGSDEDSVTGIVIGIVVGVLVLMFIVAVVIILKRKGLLDKFGRKDKQHIHREDFVNFQPLEDKNDPTYENEVPDVAANNTSLKSTRENILHNHSEDNDDTSHGAHPYKGFSGNQDETIEYENTVTAL